MAKLSIIRLRKVKSKSTRTKVGVVGFKAEKCMLYSCLRRIMRLSRWFGFFPVEGLDAPSISQLRFNMKTLYGVYIVLTIFGQLIMGIVTFRTFLVNNDIQFSLLSHFIFYLNATVSSMMLLHFARNWTYLMKEVADLETCLAGIRLDKHITLKTVFLSYFILLLGLVEHLMSMAYAFYSVMICLNDFSLDSLRVWVKFYGLKLYSITDSTWINLGLGMVLDVVNKQATFMWTFIDVLVLSTTMYLLFYFKSFNKQIENQRYNKSTDWKSLREKYSLLAQLVKKIDYYLSLFVMQSFFTNLFFTCLQLMNTIKNTPFKLSDCTMDNEFDDNIISNLKKAYYSFSFIFLITRTLVVTILTADVDSYASEPITVLGEIHASCYNIEIQRFYRQLKYNTVGLSGVFFDVNRRMIIQVLGTLVTYELMLLQFKPHRPPPAKEFGTITENLTHAFLDYNY